MGAKLSAAGGQYQLGQNAEINVTPFVDVLLVLLIIFMLAIPLATVAVKLDLPVGIPRTPPRDPVLVSIWKGGRVFVNGTEVALAGLDAAIVTATDAADPYAEPITVRAERDVRYGEFMGVLNRIRADGYGKLNLMTEKV